VFSAIVILLIRPQPIKASRGTRRNEAREAWPFAALMIGVGALLIVAPEFLYLKDLFGSRMNTVFKFYYSAWILWGLATAYIIYELWSGPPGWRTLLAAVVTIPLVLGMAYPVLGVATKTNDFQSARGPTLDGTLHLAEDDPADYAAIQWMKANLKEGVVAEAVGGSYTEYARISAHTGFPTPLGWEFHEIQWRGNADLLGSRKADVEHLYETRNPQDALDIMTTYGIVYVYIGPLERSSYRPLVETTFASFMNLVYQQGEVSIYALPGKGTP
jgi:uncharacterized membrane protein